MSGALAGLKIIELASYVSGPFASMMLADLGAEVIKIEVPGQGDPFRGWGHEGYSPTFRILNRNKRSLCLNLQSVEGKEIFLKLASDADVLIENMRPGALERLGLGYDTLAAANPRLVYCAISGYGSDGPYRDRPGYDTIGQAMGGLLSVLTDRSHPTGTGASLSDHLTGLYALYAIQGALLARVQTGRGQKVETSLLQATVAFCSENGVRYLESDIVADRNTRLHTAQVYAFAAGDGLPFVVHLSSPQKFWHSLVAAIERSELRDDPRFIDRSARVRNYDALDAILRDVFATAPRTTWLDRLEASDVPAAPILDMKEVFDDPQVKHLGMVVEMSHPTMGPVRQVGSGIRMSDTPPQLRTAPPTLGENTREILAGLGYSNDALLAMTASGVIQG